MSTRIIECEDDNISVLRQQHPDGLHFVVGDTHGEWETLQALMHKIAFEPEKDHIFFVGDYNAGGDPRLLLDYLSRYYQADCRLPGFHLIRGNHEWELYPDYPLENLPDLIVIRGNSMNYYIVHAGMVSGAFDLIREDIKHSSIGSVHAYRLDDSCAGYDAPFRQMIWSRRGLYSQKSRWRIWPSEEALSEDRACIIHGHSPYCFFMDYYSYGANNVFWKRQHVFFSEDLHSFNLDSNIKGRFKNGEGYRGLTCLCIEVLEEISAQNSGYLSTDAICSGPNGVFSVEYKKVCRHSQTPECSLDRILNAAPKMKTITLDSNGKPVIIE